MVFDVGLDYFFGDKPRKRTFSIVHASDRMKFPDRAGSPKPNYFFECLAFSAQEKGMKAFLAEFPSEHGMRLGSTFTTAPSSYTF